MDLDSPVAHRWFYLAGWFVLGWVIGRAAIECYLLAPVVYIAFALGSSTGPTRPIRVRNWRDRA